MLDGCQDLGLDHVGVEVAGDCFDAEGRELFATHQRAGEVDDLGIFVVSDEDDPLRELPFSDDLRELRFGRCRTASCPRDDDVEVGEADRGSVAVIILDEPTLLRPVERGAVVVLVRAGYCDED